VKAAIAMSATPPASRKHYDETYAKIRIPIFHMTGTLDSSPIGGAEPADRRIPFDHIRGADQYLVTFDGADHMVFSGRMVEAGRGERDALFQKYILSASTAFWDAYLKGEEPARSWLTGNGFTSSLGDVGKFEKKLQDRAK